MNIRDEIRAVNTAISNTLDLYRIYAKEQKLSYNAFLILYTLYDYGECTQKQIGSWWALPKQTVHGVLQELEKQGYLHVRVNEDNRKERLISFSEKGQDYAQSMLAPLLAMEKRVMLKLEEAGRVQLIQSNMQYYELLRKEILHDE